MNPAIMYGTAWKEENTKRLVLLAIDAGFRAIDTANQRKHYFEAAVGEALAEVYARGKLRREDFFLQTKFTHRGGQDDRLPYDERAPVAAQVRQSFASSLEHLKTAKIDSYVLHGPSLRRGLAEQDVEAWRAMEEIQQEGLVDVLGVSNVTFEQLKTLTGLAKVQPSYVQNRCYASQGWDRDVRRFCLQRGIVYQGFSLLTANGREIEKPAVKAIAKRHQLSIEQVVFAFAKQVGMLPLTGTTSAEHMKKDLHALGASLTADDIATIESIG